MPAETVHIVAAPSGRSALMSASVWPAGALDFALFAAAVLRQRSTRKIRLASDDLAFFLGGTERLNRAETKALIRRYRNRNADERLINQFQISDIHCDEFYSTIDDDWISPDEANRAQPPRSDAANDIAIYIHLFHSEQWSDFCWALAGCPIPFDLHVNLPEPKSALEAEIAARFPQSTFHHIENRGRDVWPFIHLLQTGVFDRYAAVCKLHSKKSDHLSNPDIDFDVGRRWRRSAILELMGSPKRVGRIVDRFRSDPSTGIVGPSNLRLRQSDSRSPSDWGASKNRPQLGRLARRLAIPKSELRMDFFAGSMFWFNPKAFSALARTGIAADDFEPEPLPEEGALPHAFERIFNVVAKAAGYKILGSREA